jgi:Flp pilus assembly protein TadD
LLQAQNHLPRAETAINENLAMIGGDQGTVSRAPAAEHGQAEHGSQDIRAISFCANGNIENEDE